MRIEIYGIGTSAEADVFATSQIIKRPTNAVLAINVDMQVRSMDERWKKMANQINGNKSFVFDGFHMNFTWTVSDCTFSLALSSGIRWCYTLSFVQF